MMSMRRAELVILVCCSLQLLQVSEVAGVHVRGRFRNSKFPVNPFIGTGGDGFGVGSTPPGVQLPFSMMRLSPDSAFDNVAIVWRHFGGYHYLDNEIRCFSHTHMVGAGVEDYGHIGVMPTREVEPHTVRNYGYRSKFSHKNETARPGYYAVLLETSNVLAELTAAGQFTGAHQYTFLGGGGRGGRGGGGGGGHYVVIDPTHSVGKGDVVNASVSFSGSNSSPSLSGWSLLKGGLTGRNGVGVRVYFVAEFLQPPSSFGVWAGGRVWPGKREAAGNDCGAYVEFEGSEAPVTLLIAISFISIEQARANLAHDWSGESFSKCLAAAEETWNSALGQVLVESQEEDTLIKFYTALYHVLGVPTQFSEADGYYLGMDGKVHQVQNGTNYYSDLSLWDTHRTHTPLLTLLQPHVSEDIVNSLVAMYEQGGSLPRWPIANVYSGCMIANHGYQIILDNYVKGLRRFNATAAYTAMKEEAISPAVPHTARPCLKEYLSLGYCPSESAGNSVSLTLAYAFDDWAVGTLAALLGRSSEASVFLNRSGNFRNVWSSEQQLMCQRSRSGEFHCPLDPAFHEWMFKSSGFTEGDAEEWRWFVPHDIPGLLALFQSNDSFTLQLEEFFDRAQAHHSNLLPNPYYWAGNEPDLLAVYLFDFVGRPDLTQKNVRWLLDNKYTSGPEGLPGNDDYGTLSAWYMWGALGLYPLTGTTTYLLGSPALEKATIKTSSGHQLLMTAVNLTAENVYVSKAVLNGREIDMKQPFVSHSELVPGGNLTFWMSNQATRFH